MDGFVLLLRDELKKTAFVFYCLYGNANYNLNVDEIPSMTKFYRWCFRTRFSFVRKLAYNERRVRSKCKIPSLYTIEGAMTTKYGVFSIVSGVSLLLLIIYSFYFFLSKRIPNLENRGDVVYSLKFMRHVRKFVF